MWERGAYDLRGGKARRVGGVRTEYLFRLYFTPSLRVLSYATSYLYRSETRSLHQYFNPSTRRRLLLVCCITFPYEFECAVCAPKTYRLKPVSIALRA